MSTQQHTDADVYSRGTIHELTDEEAFELFDCTVQRYLCISGEEFLSRYDAGEYAEGRQEPRVETLIMLIPLVRDVR